MMMSIGKRAGEWLTGRWKTELPSGIRDRAPSPTSTSPNLPHCRHNYTRIMCGEKCICVYMCGNMQPPHPQPTQLNSCTCTHTYDNLHTHSYTHAPIHLSQAHTHLPIHLLQAHIHLPRHNHPTPRIACWSVTMSIFLPHLTRMHTHPMCNHEKINQPQLYKKDFLDQELLK